MTISWKEPRVTDSLQSYHYCTKSFFIVYVIMPSTTYKIGILQTLNVHNLLLNCPTFQSFHLLKRQSSFVLFYTLLNTHAPPIVRKIINNSTSQSINHGYIKKQNVNKINKVISNLHTNTIFYKIQKLFQAIRGEFFRP